jgi:hypothetical protein
MIPVHDPSRTPPSWWKIKKARLRHLQRTIRGAFGCRWRQDTTKFPLKERQAASGATGRSKWTLSPAKRRKSSGSATRACDKVGSRSGRRRTGLQPIIKTHRRGCRCHVQAYYGLGRGAGVGRILGIGPARGVGVGRGVEVGVGVGVTVGVGVGVGVPP